MLNSYIGYNLHCFLFLEFLLVQIFLFLVYQIFSRFRLFYYICVKICFGLHDSVFNLSKFVLISMFLFLIRQNLFWSPCFCFWFVKFVLVLIFLFMISLSLKFLFLVVQVCSGFDIVHSGREQLCYLQQVSVNAVPRGQIRCF